MKTKSITKAPLNSVAVILEKGEMGYVTYEEFNQPNQDQFTAHHKNIVANKVKLETHHETIEELQCEISDLKKELATLRQAFEDVIKGVLTR